MLEHSTLIILVVMLTTYFTRIWPFIVFNAKNPPNDFVRYLGRALSCSVIGMLVVYCFKDTQILEPPYGINEIIAFLSVVFLHQVFKAFVLSITIPTILYMFLTQSHVLEKIF
ncbi:branched-chain amino acid transporter permease [Helicobacter cetorum]|uniref:branched-chain amino acid transporter permease n=1 Tax=Helicobacter cetorum TaxID=138563 RepID=UPI000CF195C8|nr:branched-chain amino acid transporter permease [Helicobacter cetorum]